MTASTTSSASVAPDLPTALSVNVNKVALVRNTRHLGIPSVTRAASACLAAGAHGITVHPRPDARHIREQDVFDLAALLQDWPGREFNIEGNPFHNLMEMVRQVRPQQATFVPDGEGQFTSDHGWNLAQDADRLRPVIAECQALGVRVSLFMDPTPEAMALARASVPIGWSSTPSPMPPPGAMPARALSWPATVQRPRRPWMLAWASTRVTTSTATT